MLLSGPWLAWAVSAPLQLLDAGCSSLWPPIWGVSASQAVPAGLWGRRSGDDMRAALVGRSARNSSVAGMVPCCKQGRVEQKCRLASIQFGMPCYGWTVRASSQAVTVQCRQSRGVRCCGCQGRYAAQCEAQCNAISSAVPLLWLCSMYCQPILSPNSCLSLMTYPNAGIARWLQALNWLSN